MPWTKPTALEVENVLNALVTQQQEAYFFTRLNNPLWIEPLESQRVFESPPPPEMLPSGGVRFPIWPVSRYLARMAKDAPDEVARILSQIETENPSIIGDMIDAALAMPAQTSRKFIGRVNAAAKARKLWTHFDDAVDLCMHLANAEEWELAIELVDAMFQPKDPPDRQGQRDEYWYSEGLKQIVPLFAAQRPQQFPGMLMDWLAGCVRAATNDLDPTQNDLSWSWRPAIEEHEQNHQHGYRSTLTGFVRVAFEAAIDAGATSIDVAVENLRAQRMLVFDRIALYLIATRAPKGGALASAVVQDQALFDDYRSKHEYTQLVKGHFAHLPRADTERWLEWVDAGPDRVETSDSIESQLGRTPASDELQARSDYWKFSKMHVIREHLTGGRRTFYESMLARYGEPELAEFSITVTSHWGHNSPLTVDQLRAVTFEAAVQLVNTWRPTPGDIGWGPSLEGLAATFRQYVHSDIGAASSRSLTLVGASPLFARAFVAEMTKAVGQNRSIEVEEVVRLCQWIVAQPTDQLSAHATHHSPLVDKDWQWAKDECARFVEAVCTSHQDGSVSFAGEVLRAELWVVLSRLREAPANSYIGRGEADADPVSTDYISIALNSSRGMVVSAVLEYARWVSRQLVGQVGGEDVLVGGFEQMPEVREFLEWHISNPSLQASASMGLRLGLLLWLDQQWLRANIEALFAPEREIDQPVASTGWAAWNAFIVGARPHIEFYQLLRPQFHAVLNHAATPRELGGGREAPLFHFVEFVLVLYGRGDLALDDDGGFVRRLLATAQPAIRRHGIEFIGRSLQGTHPVPAEVVARFGQLWDVYWSTIGEADAKQQPGAWLFGLWFATGRFDGKWSLNALAKFVDGAGMPEPDHAVVERLCALVDDHPVMVARLLRQIVEADDEGWHVHGWMEDARTILSKAMGIGGDAAAEARRAIEWLGRRGYVEFGKLLKEH